MQPEPLYAPDSAYHQERRWIQPHTVRCLEAAIARCGRPASLLDVGCGEGTLVRWCRAHQIDAMGIDLAAPVDTDFRREDLCEPVDLGRDFDWVLCWEVAEHLPKTAAATLCETLVRHLAHEGRLLFTAARPGQSGPGHINCQSPIYWVNHFAAQGLLPATKMTLALAKDWLQVAPQTPWYGRNLLVFQRGTP